MNKHSNFGFSSILLTFVMICIITFLALTLLTANSDHRLSQKVADRNSAYYEAEQAAYEQLADIDALLLQEYNNSTSPENFFALAGTTLTKNVNGTWTSDGGQYFFTYQTDITTDQYLLTELQIIYPESRYDSFYRIVKWQSVHDAQTIEEGPLNLIGSDE